MKTKLAAILILSAGWLAGCGSDEPAPDAAPVPRAPATQQQAQSAKPADLTAKMARAVTSGKSAAPVELKYEIRTKPEPGKPIEIDLALIAGAHSDSLTVAVTATPGLEIVTGSNGTFGPLNAGEIANHKVTAQVAQIDVVYLTVTATLAAAGTSQARTFAIPLIVGSPAPATPSSASAKPDATGQKVQGMPAKETK